MKLHRLFRWIYKCQMVRLLLILTYICIMNYSIYLVCDFYEIKNFFLICFIGNMTHLNYFLTLLFYIVKIFKIKKQIQ